jgi:hypothetical protein
MPLTEQQQQAILDALPPLAPCALCEKDDTWTLNASGVVVLRFQEDKRDTKEALACVAIICSNCGNTHLIDLTTLGLADFA